MSAEYVIRPFDENRDADYAAAVALRNAIEPEYRTTIEEMRHGDQNRDPRCKHERWLAETPGGGSGGQVIGSGSFEQSPWAYHPHRFGVGVSVHPEYEGRDIGSALFDHLRERLAGHAPEALRCHVREDRERALRFAQDRGFVEVEREWESRLDVAAFDPAPFAEAREKPMVHGIAIKSLRELESDPDRERKLWELESETFLDVPSTETLTPVPFAQFQKNVMGSPNLLPEAFLIAVATETGQYVGSSALWRRQADRDLDTGLTAVRRSHRRRGIALAMKLRVIEYARSVGCPTIRTENNVSNRPMLSINEALGFVKQPAWISLVRTLADG